MILRHLLRNATAEIGGGGGGGGAAQPKPVQTPTQKPTSPREPTTEEKAVTFELKPGDIGFIDDFNDNNIVQLPKQNVDKDKVLADTTSLEAQRKSAATESEKTEEKTEEPSTAIKPVVKQKEEKKESASKKPAVEPIVPIGKTQARDYTGFDEKEKKIFGAMSNEAFAYVAPLLKEQKELAKAKNSLYLQNPEAFRLDPVYRRLEEDSFYFNNEVKFWQQQLLNAKAGQPWQSITGYDKNGRIVLSEPKDPTPADEEQLRLYLQETYNAVTRTEQQKQQYASQYQQIIQNDNQQIDAIRAQQFGWVTNPKLLDGEIIFDDGRTETVKQVRDGIIGLFPAYHHNNPVTQVAADLYVALQITRQQLREAHQNKRLAEVKTEEVLRAEPSSELKPAAEGNGKVIGGVKEFSLQGFPV